MNGVGNYEGWRWIFIIEGIPTVITGIVCYFYLPDYPQTCKFLDGGEREFVLARLANGGANSSTEPHFVKSQFWATLKDPVTYMFCIGYFLRCTPLYCITFALPSILLSMGFKDVTAQLLTIPPYFASVIACLIISYMSDRTKLRVPYLVGCSFIEMLGFIGMAFAPTVVTKYIFAIITTTAAYASVPTCKSGWY